MSAVIPSVFLFLLNSLKLSRRRGWEGLRSGLGFTRVVRTLGGDQAFREAFVPAAVRTGMRLLLSKTAERLPSAADLRDRMAVPWAAWVV